MNSKDVLAEFKLDQANREFLLLRFIDLIGRQAAFRQFLEAYNNEVNEKPVVNNEIEIEFTASGTIKQTISLFDNVKYTKKELVEALANGTIWTTVQENGEVLTDEDRVIGTVINVDNDLEYEDFRTNYPLLTTAQINFFSREIERDAEATLEDAIVTLHEVSNQTVIELADDIETVNDDESAKQFRLSITDLNLLHNNVPLYLILKQD